jgi:hypothetical protein
MNLVARCGCVKTVPMNDRQLHRCPDHDETFVHPSALKPRKPLSRISEKKAPAARKRGSTLKRGKGFSASKAQQEKVRGRVCVGCGDPFDWEAGGAEQSVDPAHLWPRSMGGCDDPLCVIPLCRRCHDRLDDPSDEFDLLPKLVDRGYAAEMAHPVEAHGISYTPLLERVTGQRWQPVPTPEPPTKNTNEAAIGLPERNTPR